MMIDIEGTIVISSLADSNLNSQKYGIDLYDSGTGVYVLKEISMRGKQEG